MVKGEYEKKGAISGPYQPVDFESDTIALDIPLEGITINDWNLTPLTRPIVSYSLIHIPSDRDS